MKTPVRGNDWGLHFWPAVMPGLPTAAMVSRWNESHLAEWELVREIWSVTAAAAVELYAEYAFPIRPALSSIGQRSILTP